MTSRHDVCSLITFARFFRNMFGYHTKSHGIAVVRGYLAVLATLLVSPVWAEVEIRAKVDQSAPQVAEAFWLTLVVRVPEQTKVVFPSVPETLGQFRVLDHRDWFDVPQGAKREWTRHLQLESLQGGEFVIPALSVGAGERTVKSEPIEIQVRSEVETQADPLQFRDLKPVLEIEPAEPESTGVSGRWPWVVAGLAVLAILAGGIMWFRRRIPQRLPGSWALQQLERLEEEIPGSTASVMIPKSAEILREYVEGQLGIRATRQTTQEFLSHTRQDERLSDGQRETLGRFLSHVDEVKFAGRQQKTTGGGNREDEAQSIQAAVDIVREFVRQTLVKAA